MKRIVVLMLSVLLLWTALPAAPVNAQGYSTDVYPVEGGNLYFDSGTGTVIGCDETVTTAVVPEKIAGVTVLMCPPSSRQCKKQKEYVD